MAAAVLNRRALSVHLRLLLATGRFQTLLVAMVGGLLLLELLAGAGIFRLQPGRPMPASWPRLFTFGDLLSWISLAWGVSIWAGEPPSARLLHRSLPFAHGASDAARVTAGLLLLALAFGVVSVFGVALAVLSGGATHLIDAPLGIWGSLILLAVFPYLVGSAFATALERPWHALTLGAFVFIVGSLLTDAVPRWMNPVSLLIGPVGMFSAARIWMTAAIHDAPTTRIESSGLILLWTGILVGLQAGASRVSRLVGRRGGLRIGGGRGSADPAMASPGGHPQNPTPQDGWGPGAGRPDPPPS